jgi:release factor glutamine methyltransferase
MAACGITPPDQSQIIDPPRTEPFEIDFDGLRLVIDPEVFEPGPMSVAIVDQLSRACSGLDAPVVADVGTGSGAIAIAFALRRPDATVYALDLSADAVRCAARNAARLEVNNVNVLHGPLLQPLLATNIKLSAITANLPYVPAPVAGVKELLRPNRWRGPRNTIVGAEHDGLGLPRALLKQAQQLLLPNGCVIIEMEEWQTEVFARENAGCYRVEVAPSKYFITLSPFVESTPAL